MKAGSPIFALILFALVPAFIPAAAATASASFSVSVMVVDTCLISPSSIGAGSYTGALLNASSAVSINCLHSTPYTLAIRSGLTQGSTPASQQIRGAGWEFAGSTLDPSSDRIGNCGRISDTEMLKNASSSMSALSPIAQIPSGQYEAAGVYADSVTVSVTY